MTASAPTRGRFDESLVGAYYCDMLFDLYIPTRTFDSVEARVRSSSDGPVSVFLGDEEVILQEPDVSYRGYHFYRHTFTGLAPGAPVTVGARQRKGGGAARTLPTAALEKPPGALRLRIGLMADLHLPLQQRHIDEYRTGTKRMAGLAYELGRKYIRRLEALGADIIVLPGDLVEPCNQESLGLLKEILGAVSVPCHPIIGNHEPWSTGGAKRFHQELGLPEEGFYTVKKNGVRMLMLSTPHPGALDRDTAQLEWLKEQLRESAPDEDVALFSHFSLMLHPCVQGPRNDGYQLLDNHREVLDLLARHKNVRLFAAGHKNVPSMMIQDGILHTLSPQLIQAPCGYDILHLFEGGASRTTYELDEQHYCEVSRAAYAYDWQERYGEEEGRSFSVAYPE